MWNLLIIPDRRGIIERPDFLHPRKTKRIKHFALVGSSSYAGAQSLTFNGIHGYFLGASNFIPRKDETSVALRSASRPLHSRA